jgi:hypothetical protein
MDELVHTYLHCRQCLASPPGQRMELGITKTGLLVSCPEHGLVVFFTPLALAQWISRPPQCDCCRGKRHRPRGGRTR